MQPAVYTLGYSGKTVAQLRAIVERLDAVLIDIRFSPASRMPQWSGKQLREQFGSRYLHLRAFGNAAYKTGGIAIADYPGGIAALRDLDTSAVILMCACGNPVECHRTVVGGLLRADGYTVTEIASLASIAAPLRHTQLSLL